MAKTMTNPLSGDQTSGLWVLLLTVASTVTTLAFACATPFPALAAIAAVYLRPRAAVPLMIAAWVVSQVIGFGFKGYPQDADTLLTGCAIGGAAVASALAALLAAKATTGRSTPIRLAATYVAGFVAFKLAIALSVPLIGHADAALSVEIMVRQFVRNAAILVGLVALYRVLTAVGVPAASASRPVTA
ncbi:hypothetical protein [Sphingomonas montana]|uniref:hypothetical protein n=1 Tax=Sphingomonas montana TaxID=1843236 RepID=UPI00101AE8D2|nr:hypothetical protein [Sphingomonas montana]